MEDCETNDCRKEKRGCKGCYYDEKEKEKNKIIYGAMLLEELNRKFIEREFGNNKGE